MGFDMRRSRRDSMINAVMQKTSKEKSINGNVFKTPFHLKPHLIIGYVGAIINVSNGRYSPAVPNVQTQVCT